MTSKISELLISALAGPMEAIIADQLSALLMKVEPLEARKTILVSMYPSIDVQLESLVKTSKSKIDDAAVRAMKTAIEDAAAQSGVELPNLDAGQSGD